MDGRGRGHDSRAARTACGGELVASRACSTRAPRKAPGERTLNCCSGAGSRQRQAPPPVERPACCSPTLPVSQSGQARGWHPRLPGNLGAAHLPRMIHCARLCFPGSHSRMQAASATRRERDARAWTSLRRRRWATGGGERPTHPRHPRGGVSSRSAAHKYPHGYSYGAAPSPPRACARRCQRGARAQVTRAPLRPNPSVTRTAAPRPPDPVPRPRRPRCAAFERRG